MTVTRSIVNEQAWREAVAQLAGGRMTLLGLWGDAPSVHMALLDESTGGIAVLTYECVDGKFPSVGAKHSPAIRLERTIRDLYGLEPAGAEDARSWLDHGVWHGGEKVSYQFLPVEGDGLHQIPVGPVHAGIIEPGHFRFTANGEFTVRLEQRLGYVHKGIESLMVGASLDKAAKLAARTSGDSTVAYSYTFALAVEAALNIEVPARATYLRALVAELERLANHLGDIGAICNDAAFALMHAQTSVLRERCLRAALASFGHRLMMDVIVPGGVAHDIALEGLAAISTLLTELRRRFPRLIELYDNTASLQDRTVSTGVVKPEYVRQFGTGGYVGRASGRAFDARRTPGYAPYGKLTFDVPVRDQGDVDARVWIRIREVEQSLSLIEQIVDALPDGPVAAEVKSAGEPREGLALAEAFRGDVLVWLRLDADGHVARCHLRDASWFQWPLLETAIEGNIVADFPLCNKSFNCSYSGHDL
jgi:Ni,Fe-hydrogenase III large subunit